MTERESKAALWIATSLGAGYFPKAPGTAGSAVGMVLVLAIGYLPVARQLMTALVFMTAVVLAALGVWAAGRAEKFFGRTDPAPVVIDEVVGQMLTLALRPDGSWKWYVVGFALFRLFDVVKPFPARRLERAPAGWGIMLDDVAAGIYGLGTLAVFSWALKFA